MKLVKKARSFFLAHKKIIFFALLFTLLLITIILLQFLQQAEKREKADIPSEVEKTITSVPSNNKNPFNPLINNTEKQRVKDAIRQRFEELGKSQPKKNNLKFNLKLSSELKKQSAFALPRAYAANDCNIELAPAAVPVYTVKSNYSANDALVLSRVFGFIGSPTSIPMVDGNSYLYSFLQSVPGTSSAYFTIDAPSGMYTYHKSFKPYTDSLDIGKLQAKIVAENLLKKSGINDKLLLTNVEEDTHMDVKLYTFTYIKEYGNFPFSNTETILDLGKLQSVCAVSKTSAMNTIQISITRKGELETFINKTRKVIKSSETKRQSLDDAVEEYEREYMENSPVDPIIVGDIENIAAGDVFLELTEAQLIWYDYGENYAQKFYVPMYLTSGTVENARVFILIPAVSKENLLAIPDVAFNNRALQFDVYYPPPPTATPVPPANTPAPGVTYIPPVDYVPVDGNYCYGNQIDYVVTCVANDAESTCGLTAAAPAESDPFNVCTGSCKNIKAETITFSRNNAVSNACEAFLKKHIPNATAHSAGNTTNGTFYCQIRGCPC